MSRAASHRANGGARERALRSAEGARLDGGRAHRARPLARPRGGESLALALGVAALLFVAGCKGDDPAEAPTSGGEATSASDGDGRCPKPGGGEREIEVSVYDTNGDGVPDVRKAYLVVRAGPDPRLILVCRESDLDGDGRKDVVRHYGDDGSPRREESDRNFDGEIDSITRFDGGYAVVKELDEDFDGRFDTKVFYEDGRILRTERDLAGRDPGAFHTDRWEYVEGGRVVRIGTDVDGDGRVDRWERDVEVERARTEREREDAQEDDEEETEKETEDGAEEETEDGAENDAEEDAEDGEPGETAE